MMMISLDVFQKQVFCYFLFSLMSVVSLSVEFSLLYWPNVAGGGAVSLNYIEHPPPPPLPTSHL